jgi:hypothetical protein
MAVLNVECVRAVVTFESDCDEKNFLEFFLQTFWTWFLSQFFFYFIVFNLKVRPLTMSLLKGP